MNWVRAAALIMSVLLAHAGSRSKSEISPAKASSALDEITSARAEVQRATTEFGADHPATAMLLSNLALAMREAGYFNYAEHYARQSVAILERRFGPNDVSLAPPLNVLAEAAVSQGHYDEAREFAARAVAIGPEAGPHYATALHNLAAVSQAQGRFQEAAELYRQALTVREKILPAGHPYIRLTRAALAQVQRSARLTARR